MPAKESFDIDGLMVFRGDLTAVDQNGNIVKGVTTPDRYFPSDREPLSDVQIGRYTNTTAYWKDHSDIVPANGDVYIYSDGATEEQGGVTVNIPKIKVGDGVTTIENLPFTDSDTQQGTAGTLNTTNESGQTPNASESLSGNVNLHKVSKTGNYEDLNQKPAIPTNIEDLENVVIDHLNDYDIILYSELHEIWENAQLHPVALTGNYNNLENKPTIPTVPTNVSAFNNDAGYLTQEADPTVPAWAKEPTKPVYDYSEINNTPTITDENVKQELTESSNSYEYPLLASKTITVGGTKTNTTRYAAGLLARGDSSIILKAANNNTLDTPSLFFRRGSDSNAGTDWAIRSTGAETGQNTPLEFLRRYGSGSSSWVSKLALYTNLIKTEVSDGIESPKFVKSNPSNANGMLLADGSDIPQSTFQKALPAYTNNAGKVLAVKNDETGLEWVNQSGGGDVNVQSDWNQTNSSADDYIKNKPTLTTITFRYW